LLRRGKPEGLTPTGITTSTVDIKRNERECRETGVSFITLTTKNKNKKT
jgi:hypothetical protein